MGDMIWTLLPWFIGLGAVLAVRLWIYMDERVNPENYEVNK